MTPEETYGTQLEPLQPECLVPIRGSSEGQLQGEIVLGTRLSEEPVLSQRQTSAGFGCEPGRHCHAQHYPSREDGRNAWKPSAAPQQEMDIAPPGAE